MAPGANSVSIKSHVTGTLTRGGPLLRGVTTEVLINLTGYQMIVFPHPPGEGPGPVQLPNLKANIVMNQTMTEGSVGYEFRRGDDTWQRVEQQIARVN